MKDNHRQFIGFLESMRKHNPALIESIVKGFKTILEAAYVPTDDDSIWDFPFSDEEKEAMYSTAPPKGEYTEADEERYEFLNDKYVNEKPMTRGEVKEMNGLMGKSLESEANMDEMTDGAISSIRHSENAEAMGIDEDEYFNTIHKATEILFAAVHVMDEIKLSVSDTCSISCRAVDKITKKSGPVERVSARQVLDALQKHILDEGREDIKAYPNQRAIVIDYGDVDVVFQVIGT